MGSENGDDPRKSRKNIIFFQGLFKGLLWMLYDIMDVMRISAGIEGPDPFEYTHS